MAQIVGFKIVPQFDKGAKAEAQKLSKELRDQGKLSDTLNKSLKKTTGEAVKGFREFGKQIKENSRDLGDLSKNFRGLESDLVRVGRAGSSAFQNIGKSILGANRDIRSALGSVVNLKNAIIGSAVVLGGRSLLAASREEHGVERRVGTEFGAARAARLKERASGLGERAAVGNAEALAAVAEIARATSTISEGQTITDPRTGKKRKLTAAEAARLQGSNTNFGVSLLERAATLRPDVPIQELAAAIASAGTDETGFRNLASVLHLNRGQVHNLLEAQTKGKIGALLTPEERKRLGVGAKQKQVGFGTLIDIAFQRSGLTEQAANAERRTRGFDRRLAGKKFADFKAEEGQQLDALLGRFGGPNMAANAERALDALRGSEGKIAATGVAGYALSGLLTKFGVKGTGKNAAAELSDELARATDGAVGEKAIPVRVINFGDAPGGSKGTNIAAGGSWWKKGVSALAAVGVPLAAIGAGSYGVQKVSAYGDAAKNAGQAAALAASDPARKHFALAKTLEMRGVPIPSQLQEFIKADVRANPALAQQLAAKGVLPNAAKAELNLTVNVAGAVGNGQQVVEQLVRSGLLQKIADQINIMSGGGLAGAPKY